MPSPQSRFNGFSLIELLVALAVFASMAALAYGGLDSVVRTRAELGRQQAAFNGLMRSIAVLDRDLRQAAARPVRGNYGEPQAAFAGLPDRVEFTRAGFANPQAEQRSNLERVSYALDGDMLERGVYPMLDRAPGSSAQATTLRDHIEAFRLRYLDASNRWSDSWPPRETDAAPLALPRAVEFRIDTKDYGEITRVIELVSSWPAQAVEAQGVQP
ncbi:MAG TPA: type II secretion system minor pseudopilin GspJ [Rudaea sp.]